MAISGAYFLPVVRCCVATSSGKPKQDWIQNPMKGRSSFTVSTTKQASEKKKETTTTRSLEEIGKKCKEEEEEQGEVTIEMKQKKKSRKAFGFVELEQVEREGGKGLKDYFEESKNLIRSSNGPPRWFSPLECGGSSGLMDNSPLLLYLPGIDGVGLGLIRHHHTLGKIFDVWCLHIPVEDRTSFIGLTELVERTVRSQGHASSDRPIYLVGESLGACIALSVAARNPDIDLVLILSNPATSFEKSKLQPLLPLLEIIPDQLLISHSYILSLMTGDPMRMTMDYVVKRLPTLQTFEELAQNVIAMPFYLSVLADILHRETLLWKLQLFKSASAFVNSRIHAIKAQTLILSSGKDQLQPSEEEGRRLCGALPKCEIRKFDESGHFLFMENGVDLVTIIKGANFYRRGRYLDHVSDYIPPTPFEFNTVYELYRWTPMITSPVIFSTLEDGKIVNGLAGIPSEGPVLMVGYHMLLGFEVIPLINQFWWERNIRLRGMGHPMLFIRMKKEGMLPPLSQYDPFRIVGAVPVSGTSFYKLMSSKSHVLLYPGGLREAYHRKGEQYKLIWPEEPEFVRMAARFGAKIVPFGAVGEDDFGEVVFDYNDQMKIPFFRNFIKELTDEAMSLRTEVNGEVGNQGLHFPGILPKFPPGRFYFYFGRPIETKGRRQELRDKDSAQKLYMQVKSEVEKCLDFLKEKRESDPYRNIFTRLAYQVTHGFNSEVPSFKI